MANPVVGVQVQLGMITEVTPGTALAVTELYEVVSGDPVALAEEQIIQDGLSGTRSEWAARTRAGNQRITGTHVQRPNAVEWSLLLPRIMGGALSTEAVALAETLPSFTVSLKKDNGTDGKVFVYAGCYVSKAVIRSSQGGPVELELTIEGMTEAITNAGTFPALTLNVATGPFIHADSSAAITVAGTAYAYRDVEITIDNMLDVDRFMNSNTRVAIPSKGRKVTVKLDGPYGANSASYPTAATLAAGVAVVVAYTNSATVDNALTLTLPKVHFPRKSPVFNGREEVLLPLLGVARATAAGNELAATIDLD